MTSFHAFLRILVGCTIPLKPPNAHHSCSLHVHVISGKTGPNKVALLFMRMKKYGAEPLLAFKASSPLPYKLQFSSVYHQRDGLFLYNPDLSNTRFPFYGNALLKGAFKMYVSSEGRGVSRKRTKIQGETSSSKEVRTLMLPSNGNYLLSILKK